MSKYVLIYDRLNYTSKTMCKPIAQQSVEKFDNFMEAVRRARDVSASGQCSNTPVIEHR